MINIEKLLKSTGDNTSPYGERLAYGLHDNGSEWTLFRRRPDSYLTTRIGYVVDETHGLEYTNLLTSQQVQCRIRQFFLIDLDDQTFTGSLHLASRNLPGATYHNFLNCWIANDYYQFHDHEWQDIRPVYESQEDLEYSVKRLTGKELIYFFAGQVLKVGNKDFKQNIFDPMVIESYLDRFYESVEFKTAEDQGLIKSRLSVAA